MDNSLFLVAKIPAVSAEATKEDTEKASRGSRFRVTIILHSFSFV